MDSHNSQGGSASHNSQPSTSGAGDQEADSRPSTSHGLRGSAAQKALLKDVVEELLFKLPDPLMTPLREEVDRSFRKMRWRMKCLDARVDRVEQKLDLILAHLLAPLSPPPPPPPPPPPSPPSPTPQNDSPNHHHSHTQSSSQDYPHHHYSSDHSPSHSHHSSSSSDQPSDHVDHISSPHLLLPDIALNPPCYHSLLYFHPGPHTV